MLRYPSRVCGIVDPLTKLLLITPPITVGWRGPLPLADNSQFLLVAFTATPQLAHRNHPSSSVTATTFVVVTTLVVVSLVALFIAVRAK